MGSKVSARLEHGRHIVWRGDADGVPLAQLIEALSELLEKHSDVDLMFGYWDYGEQLVVTAPDKDN